MNLQPPQLLSCRAQMFTCREEGYDTLPDVGTAHPYRARAEPGQKDYGPNVHIPSGCGTLKTLQGKAYYWPADWSLLLSVLCAGL